LSIPARSEGRRSKKGKKTMTAIIGPAGLALIGFVGVIASLAATHSIELFLRRSLGVGPHS